MSTISKNAPEETASFKVEIIISDILKWGVAVSLGLMVIGTILCFFCSNDYGQRGGTHEDLVRLVSADDAVDFSWSWFRQGLIALHGQAVIVAGLLLLIATPVLRVAVSIVAYVLERDWRYVAITTTVLILLAVSLLLGKVG